MKHTPAAISPRQPARRKPTWIAISVEFGPGIRLVAPTKSRNSWSVSHLRRFTVSSCSMATWAAGPPKAVIPNLRNRAATSINLRDNSRLMRCLPVAGRTTSGPCWSRPEPTRSSARRQQQICHFERSAAEREIPNNPSSITRLQMSF